MKCEELNKSRAEKFYAPSTLQKTEKKKLNGREQKKGTHFTTVNLLGSFLELFIFEPTEPNYN